MPFLAALALASATASIGVTAQIPPRCDYAVAAGAVSAWCNAGHWSVIARGAAGSEETVWQGVGPGSIRLPATPGVTYRLQLDY